MMLVSEAVTHDIGPLLSNVLTGGIIVVSNIATSYITYLVNKNTAIKTAVVVAEKEVAKKVVENASVLGKVSENDAKTDELIGSVAKMTTLVNGNTDAMREELREARAIAAEAHNYVAEVREQLAALRGLAGKAVADEAAVIVASTKSIEAESASSSGIHATGEAKIVVKGGDAGPGQYRRVDTSGMGS